MAAAFSVSFLRPTFLLRSRVSLCFFTSEIRRVQQTLFPVRGAVPPPVRTCQIDRHASFQRRDKYRGVKVRNPLWTRGMATTSNSAGTSHVRHQKGLELLHEVFNHQNYNGGDDCVNKNVMNHES